MIFGKLEDKNGSFLIYMNAYLGWQDLKRVCIEWSQV